MNLLTRPVVMGKSHFAIITLLWFLLAIISALFQVLKGPDAINNFQIYTGTFHHLLHSQDLYALYPFEYNDSNHYGPVFSIIIAPFALLPTPMGAVMWCAVSAWILFYSITQLPLSPHNKSVLLLIALPELLTSVHNMQFNIMLAGWMVLAYVLVHKGHVFWATLFVIAGTLVKLYGIIGVMLIFFTDKKAHFILSGIFWAIVLFLLPALLSSFSFILISYKSWYSSLVEKNKLNEAAGNYMQDVSVMGMIRRIFSPQGFSDLYVLIPAGIGCLLPLLRRKFFQNTSFQMLFLSLLMISTVIYSTGAESSTYIIAAVAVGIWYVIPASINANLKLIFLSAFLLISSIGTTDLMPNYIQVHLIRPYSLKALPVFIIWCTLLYEMLYKKFEIKAS